MGFSVVSLIPFVDSWLVVFGFCVVCGSSVLWRGQEGQVEVNEGCNGEDKHEGKKEDKLNEVEENKE